MLSSPKNPKVTAIGKWWITKGSGSLTCQNETNVKLSANESQFTIRKNNSRKDRDNILAFIGQITCIITSWHKHNTKELKQMEYLCSKIKSKDSESTRHKRGVSVTTRNTRKKLDKAWTWHDKIVIDLTGLESRQGGYYSWWTRKQQIVLHTQHKCIFIHYQTRKLQNCPYKVLNSYYIIMGNKKRDKHQETKLCKY